MDSVCHWLYGELDLHKRSIMPELSTTVMLMSLADALTGNVTRFTGHDLMYNLHYSKTLGFYKLIICFRFQSGPSRGSRSTGIAEPSRLLAGNAFRRSS